MMAAQKKEFRPFEKVPFEAKKRIIDLWKFMRQEDKEHFINQVALALSIWGSDDQGKTMVARVMEILVKDGSKNLSDFGIYIDKLMLVEQDKALESRGNEIVKVIEVVDAYRIRYEMSSEPHKTIF
jgi:pantothenate kinase-related protein Tda10